MNQLMVHAGGWSAKLEDLDGVAVPEETASYYPVPYGRFVEEVKLHVPRFGLKVEREEYALAREGGQMFGVLTCTNGTEHRDYALAIGLRNSYDRSLSVGLVVGSRVFCCDNLAFSGEVQMARKHTAKVFRDLPDLIYQMLSKVKVMQQRLDTEIAGMKALTLASKDTHHLMVEAIRERVVPAATLPKLLNAWGYPTLEEFREKTAWSLYNLFTDFVKSRSPQRQIDGTLRLTKVFRRELAL